MGFFIEQLTSNYLLMSAVLSWFIAQVLKTAIDAYFNKGINWERMTGSGGMPSSHSSTVVSLAVAAGISYGVDSAVFAVALIFAIVVMYDATGVRRETGKQAVILNRLLLDNPFSWSGEEFEKVKRICRAYPVAGTHGGDSRPDYRYSYGIFLWLYHDLELRCGDKP